MELDNNNNKQIFSEECPTGLNIDLEILEDLKNFDIEIMRIQQEKFKQKNQSKNTIAETEEQKAYFRRIKEDKKQSGTMTVETLNNRLNEYLNRKESVLKEPYHLNFDEVKEFYWKIYKNHIYQTGKLNIAKDEKRNFILQNLVKYLIGDVSGDYDLKKGLWICGGIGTGKSTIMEAASDFSKLISYNKFDFCNAKSLVIDSRMKKDFGVLEKYLNAPWCLDDVASESNVNIFGNSDEIIQTFLEMFYINQFKKGRVMHVTSNLHLDDLQNRYNDPRLISRCKEMFNIIVLNGKDLRLN